MRKALFTRKRILIASGVLAALLIAGGVAAYSFSVPKSPQGAWELIVNPETAKATSDEANRGGKVFYSFDKPGEYGDGTYKTYYDGGVEEGAYKLSEQDGKRLINMGTEDLVYEISGSRLFGGVKLTITYPAQTDAQTGQATPAQEYVFAQAQAPAYEKETYRSFTTDKALVGKWTTADRTLAYFTTQLSYTETVQFTDSGILTIRYESADLALDRLLYYAYTAEDGTLTFSPVTDKETTYSVGYGFDKDGNLIFAGDTTSSSIFADAFFSDVTYKASE